MANRIVLSDAEVAGLGLIDDDLTELVDTITLDSLNQRGLSRLSNNRWYLTPWGEEVLASINEPLVGYTRKTW